VVICPHQANFLAPLPGKKKTSARGVLHAHPLLCFKFCFTLFLLALFYQKHKKSSILYSCFYLSAFSFARMATPENTKLCDFTSTNNSGFIGTPIAPPAPATNFYAIKPALLNLVMKEQFFGAGTDDAVAHLNNCRWISCRKNMGYHAEDPKIRTQGAEHGRSWIITKHGDGSLESSNAQCTAERDAELYPGSGPSW
jgi:hypothetical protein